MGPKTYLLVFGNCADIKSIRRRGRMLGGERNVNAAALPRYCLVLKRVAPRRNRRIRQAEQESKCGPSIYSRGMLRRFSVIFAY
jgi:hypothetical protein